MSNTGFYTCGTHGTKRTRLWKGTNLGLCNEPNAPDGAMNPTPDRGDLAESNAHIDTKDSNCQAISLQYSLIGHCE